MKKTPRKIALEVLLHIHRDNGYSNLVLAGALRQSELEERDKAFVSALVYGVLERQVTLDYVVASHTKKPLREITPEILEIIRIGVYQILYMDKVPARAAVNESVELTKRVDGGRAAGFVNGILRSVERSGSVELPPEKNWATHMGIKYACPTWLVRLWARSYGKETCEKILKSLLGRPPLTVRVNMLETEREALIQMLQKEGVSAQPHPYLCSALNLNGTGAVEKLFSYREGYFHVQDAASQICCGAVGAEPGETVADVCAAPGGKSFTLAQQMRNQGTLYSFDLYEQRVRLIQEGAARLHLTNLYARVRDALSPRETLSADRILCDVPCSGLGILRRKPEIRCKRPAGLDNLPDMQYRVLCRSAEAVRIGGFLIYSTCSLNPAENDAVVSRFLRENDSFRPGELVLPPGMTKGRDEPDCQITLMPHLHQTDGFFIAVFRKVA